MTTNHALESGESTPQSCRVQSPPQAPAYLGLGLCRDSILTLKERRELEDDISRIRASQVMSGEAAQTILD